MNASGYDNFDYYVEDDGTVMRWNDGANDYVADVNATSAVQAVMAAAPTVSGTVVTEASTSSTFGGFLTSLSNALPTIIQAKAQHDLLKANLDRAARGLPPLNAQNYMPGLNFGLSPETTKLVVMLGVGALGIMALKTLAK